NECMVVGPDEMIVVNKIEDQEMKLTLAYQPDEDAICTMIYAPVTQVIEIPNLVDPADGVPTVEVNGLDALLQRTRTIPDVTLSYENYGMALRFDSAEARFLPTHEVSANNYLVFVSGVVTFGNRCQ